MAKGMFRPTKPEKYLGDVTKIRFLSHWELKFMQFCDLNPRILNWASEELQIPYIHPFKKRRAAYWPDFLIRYQDPTGKLLTEVIEIKPQKQTHQTKKSSTYDKVQLAINYAKWEAAKSYCDSAGMTFKVLTEQQLFR